MSGSWILFGSRFFVMRDVNRGVLGVEIDVASISELRISPFRIPVVGARIRNALSSRSPFSSQTRIIATISSGSGNRSRPGGSFS